MPQATADISSPGGSGDVQIVGESKLKSAEIALSRVPLPWENREENERGKLQKRKGRRERDGERNGTKRGEGGRRVKIIRSYCRACVADESSPQL